MLLERNFNKLNERNWKYKMRRKSEKLLKTSRVHSSKKFKRI